MTTTRSKVPRKTIATFYLSQIESLGSGIYFLRRELKKKKSFNHILTNYNYLLKTKEETLCTRADWDSMNRVTTRFSNTQLISS